eukprot:Em0377g1a
MAVIVSDRLLTVGRGRDREGLMPAISGRDRDRQGSNPRITKYRAKKSISYESKAFSAELKIAFVMDTCTLISRRLPLLQFSYMSLVHPLESVNNQFMLNELKCAVCSNILSQPLELQCGTLVCVKCLQEWIAASGAMNCPCCSEGVPLVSSHVRPAPDCSRDVKAGDYHHLHLSRLPLLQGDLETAQHSQEVLQQGLVSTRSMRADRREGVLVRSISEGNFCCAQATMELITAARNGDIAAVRRLLREGHVGVNVTDKDGWSPLHKASDKGHLEIVKTLIEAGANVNQAANKPTQFKALCCFLCRSNMLIELLCIDDKLELLVLHLLLFDVGRDVSGAWSVCNVERCPKVETIQLYSITTSIKVQKEWQLNVVPCRPLRTKLKSLKGGRCISKDKRHDVEFKKPFSFAQSSLFASIHFQVPPANSRWAPVEWGRCQKYFNRSEVRAFVWLVVRCFEAEFANISWGYLSPRQMGSIRRVLPRFPDAEEKQARMGNIASLSKVPTRKRSMDWSSACDAGRSILSLACPSPVSSYRSKDVTTLAPISFGSSIASSASFAVNFADVNCFGALLPCTKRDVWAFNLGKKVVQRELSLAISSNSG